MPGSLMWPVLFELHLENPLQPSTMQDSLASMTNFEPTIMEDIKIPVGSEYCGQGHD